MNASEESLAELGEKISISDDLDVEFVTQPNDFYHAAIGFALAISLRDKAKNDLEVAESELYLMFRREASSATTRPTEAQLDAMVKSNEVRLEYFETYLTTKQLADRWMALRDSFIQKGHALRELAELHKLNYFGERTTSAASEDAGPRIRRRAQL